VINLETITALFNQNKCPSLKGKPKIFLIKAVQREDRVPGSDPSSSQQSLKLIFSLIMPPLKKRRCLLFIMCLRYTQERRTS